MPFSLFLNSLPEPYLSFYSESLDYYHTLTYLCMCCVLLLLFYFLVKVPFTWTFWENEHTQKYQGRDKRRRKGGTRKGCRHCQREEEEKRLLISLLNSFAPPVSSSPVGQHHDTIRFRQLLCPDPSCEVCNNATTEMDRLLSSLALEDAAPSVSSLGSTAPLTEPSFSPSPGFSAVSTGNLVTSLPQSFPQQPSKLSLNPVTPLGDFPSMSPQVHSLPPDTVPPLKSEFAVDGSPLKRFSFPSLPPHDTENEKKSQTMNAICHDYSNTQDINLFPDLAQTLNPNRSVTYYIRPSLSVSPPPDYSLATTQPKSIHIPSKPALESSSPHSTGALSTHVLQGTDHPSLPISDFSCQEAHVKDSLKFTLAQHDSNLVKDMRYDSKKDQNSYMMSLSETNSMVSGQSASQRKLANALKVHLSKKFEEISEGCLPVTVHSSYHVTQQTLPAQSHMEIKQESSPPSMGGEYCLNTSQELSFLESKLQQMMEAHITKFHMEMLQDLPAKVLESIEIFKSRDTSSHSLFNSKSSTSTNVISKVDSKSGSFMPRQGSSKPLNHPHPATSRVGKEGQGTLRRLPSDIPQWRAEEFHRTLDAGQTLLPVTNSIIGKEIHGHYPGANICPPKLPTREAGARHEPKDQCVNSSQGKKMNSEPVPMTSLSRSEEFDALQSKMSDVLTTSKLGISQRMNVSESRGVTTVRTKGLPAKCSVLQYPNSADLQEQLMGELKWEVEKQHREAQDQGVQMSQASESLIYKIPLTHAQGVSSVDKAAPQMLHVHLENREVSMEQPQELWVAKNFTRLCQDKKFAEAAKKVSPIGSTSEEFGRMEVRLGTCQPRWKRFPILDLPFKERLESKSFQTPSQKGQSPPESIFRNKISQFFQWLHPGTTCKQQEYTQEKGIPISSAQSRGTIKSRANIKNFLEEKLGRRHATDITCPQEPLPSAVKFGKAQHQAVVKAKTEPVQGHPFSSRASSCKVTNTKPYGQETVFRDKDRHPQKVVGLKDQLLCQKPPHSVPRRWAVPCTSPTCRLPAGQVPLAALTTAGGSCAQLSTPTI